MNWRQLMIKEGFSDRLVEAFDDTEEEEDNLLVKAKTYLHNIQENKPLPMWIGITAFTGLSIIGASLGAMLATYVFFGICTLAGIIAIVERSKYIKHVVVRMNMFLDMTIFGATVYATAALGVTVAGALTFAGLGYSLVYAPILRQFYLVPRHEDIVEDIEHVDVTNSNELNTGE